MPLRAQIDNSVIEVDADFAAHGDNHCLAFLSLVALGVDFPVLYECLVDVVLLMFEICCSRMPPARPVSARVVAGRRLSVVAQGYS